ncbi:MAG: hypothetical protein V4508_22335 [Pseudomonadota bacterium]
MRTILITVLALSLTACATEGGGRVKNGMSTPLHDFNLVSTDIPTVLSDARKQPYLMPVDDSCAGVAADIEQLDGMLGPDVDAAQGQDGAGDAVGNAAMNALQGVVDGFVPFRSWVRKLSGAEQHSRDVAAAIVAGSVRRAFLKGVSLTRSCPRLLVAPRVNSPGANVAPVALVSE